KAAWDVGDRGDSEQKIQKVLAWTFSLKTEDKVLMAAIERGPNGQVLTVSEDGIARVWMRVGNEVDGIVRTPLVELKHAERVTAVASLAEGMHLTVSGYKSVHLWTEFWTEQKRYSWKPLCPPMAHSDRVTSFALSRDSRHLVTAC